MNTPTDKKSWLKYDQNFKTVIHRGTILSWILQGCIGELNGQDYQKIKEGLDIGADGFTVRGKETEQFSGTNGPVIMDNIFDVRLPGSGETVSVIVDLEAQNDSTPYPIGKRAEYYLGRLVSAQKGVDFSNSDYGNLRRVYSIWIMMNPPEKNRNTILRYKMTPSTVGKPGEIYELNTFNAIFVNLGGDYDESLPKELKFMSALFMNGLTENERKDLMTKTYKISAKEYPSKELRQMGVFGEDCKRRYTREGYAQGLAEGKAEGKAEGRLESKIEIVMSLISRGYTEEDALEIVQATPEELKEICSRIHNS